MTNHHHKTKEPGGNFWFNFTLGTLFGAGGLFILGTQQGRKLLKKAMEMAENLEGSAAEMIASLEEKVGDQEKKIGGSLHSVLEKIKMALPAKKEEGKK